MDLTIALFLLVYLAMGFGHLPGLKVDRPAPPWWARCS